MAKEPYIVKVIENPNAGPAPGTPALEATTQLLRQRGINGEMIYLRQKERLLDAIRRAEGTPTYGLLVGPLAVPKGTPEPAARARASQLLDSVYIRWVRAGRPGDFLVYLAYGGPGYAGWAPLGAPNDPQNLNKNWLPNVMRGLGLAVPDMRPPSVQAGPIYEIHKPGSPQWLATMEEFRKRRQAGETPIITEPKPTLKPTVYLPPPAKPGLGERIRQQVTQDIKAYTAIAQQGPWWARLMLPLAPLATVGNVLETTVASVMSGGYPTYLEVYQTFLPTSPSRTIHVGPFKAEVSPAHLAAGATRFVQETLTAAPIMRAVTFPLRRAAALTQVAATGPEEFYDQLAFKTITRTGRPITRKLIPEKAEEAWQVIRKGLPNKQAADAVAASARQAQPQLAIRVIPQVGPEGKPVAWHVVARAGREVVRTDLPNKGAAEAVATAYRKANPGAVTELVPVYDASGKVASWTVEARAATRPQVVPRIVENPQTKKIDVEWYAVRDASTAAKVAGSSQVTPQRVFYRLARDIPDLEERLTVASNNVDTLSKAVTQAPKQPPTLTQQANRTLVKWFSQSHDLWEYISGVATGRRARFWRGMVRSADTVMATEMGEPGTLLVRMMDEVENMSRGKTGEIIHALGPALRGVDLKKVRQALHTGDYSALSQAERAAADIIKRTFDDLYVQAYNAGVPVETYIEHYWPQMIDWKKLDKTARQHVIEQIAKNRKISKAEAERILEDFIKRRRGGRPFGNLERERLAEIPEWLRRSPEEELYHYIYAANRRIAQARVLGPNSENVTQILKAIERAGLDSVFAQHYTMLRLGDNPFWVETSMGLHNLVSSVNNLQVAAKLPLAVFGNMFQTLNNLLLVDVRSFARGILAAARSHPESMQFVARTGALLEKHFQGIKRFTEGTTRVPEGAFEDWAESVLRTTQFITVEGANRYMTALIGREWVRDIARTLQSGGKFRLWGSKNVEQAKQALHLLGFTDEDITRIATQGLHVADEIKAAQSLVNMTQFPLRPTTVGLFWNTAWGRMLTLFMRFPMQQTMLLQKAFKHDPVRTLAVLGTVFPLAGELSADMAIATRRAASALTHPFEQLRAVEEGRAGPGTAIQNLLQERAYWDPTLLERYFTNMGYVGGLGIMWVTMRAFQAEPRQYRDVASRTILGVNLSTLIDAAGGVIGAGHELYRYARGEQPTWSGTKGLIRTGLGMLPYAQIFREPILELTRTSEGRKRLLRDRIRKAWEKQDWQQVRALQQEYFRRFKEHYTDEEIARSLKQSKARQEKRRRVPATPPVTIPEETLKKLMEE